MKFIIDDKIPYIKGVLEPFGEVVYLPGAKTTPEVVKDADVLITRTRTICNERLLSGSSIKFIATATIGYDHIDTSYCDNMGIKWVNAAGCNSRSVEQYMASALFVLATQKGFSLKDKTIGIVGVGHVGSKVARVCKLFGMKVLLNDPPRARKEGSEKYCTFGDIIQKADIITFHVPLTLKGEDSTYHLADSSFFEALKLKPIILNSSRGGIIETKALKQAYTKNQLSGIVLDCWENEPQIDLELLKMADITTPHIAGYSKDGKANGTSLSVQAISRFFNLGIDTWQAEKIDSPAQTTIFLDGLNLSEEEIISKIVLSTYDIRTDDAALRSNPELFEKLREDYPVRREYPVYKLHTMNVKERTLDKLELLGFKI